MTDQNQKKKPALNVFTRRKNADGTTGLGSQIGVGFDHSNGNGFTICLDAMPFPIDGRLDLVAFPIKSKSGDQ